MAKPNPNARILGHTQQTRDKIKAGVILDRLTKHIQAEKPLMDTSQVNAAKALLNKVLPDLKAIEHSGGIEHSIPDELKDWLGKDK